MLWQVLSMYMDFLCIHRYRNMMTVAQQNSELFKIDEHTLKLDNDSQISLFMSKLSGRRIRSDIRRLSIDLNQIQVDTMITLNEDKEISFINMVNENISDKNTFSTYVKEANIEHIVYPIPDRFISKSMHHYMKMIVNLVMNSDVNH